MAKSVVCKLPHLFGKKIKISTAIYDIGQNGLCADMKDQHADELLRLPVWDLDEAQPPAAPAHVQLPIPTAPKPLHLPEEIEALSLHAELPPEPVAELDPKAADERPGERQYGRKYRKGSGK